MGIVLDAGADDIRDQDGAWRIIRLRRLTKP